MSDQVETKQVTWEDLEVAEEQKVCRGCFDPLCGWDSSCGREENNEYLSHSELARMKNVFITVNVSMSEWNKALEQAVQEQISENVPVYQYAGRGQFERVGIVAALCTPTRNPITRYEGDCSDGS